MAIFQGAIFLFMGMGLLMMDWRALKSGWLPCGPNGLKGRLKLKRDEQPLGYWVMFRQPQIAAFARQAKLGASCRVKVLVGKGLATLPYRVLRDWEGQTHRRTTFTSRTQKIMQAAGGDRAP